MKKNVIGDLILFFKRKFPVILFTILIGNFIVYWSNRDIKPYYRSSISIYVRAVYYDPVKKMLDALNKSDNSNVFSNKPSSVSYSYTSYRNEDIYIFDLYMDAPDTADVRKGIDYARKIIRENNSLETTYYNNMKAVNDLYSEADSVYAFASIHKNDLVRKEIAGKYDISPEINLLDLNIRKFNFKRMYNDIQRDLKINYPEGNTFSYETINRKKKHLVATVFFAAIGIFLAIFFEQIALLKKASADGS